MHGVKAFAFDVDGVFAKSTVLLSPEGSLMRSMNTKDGFAVKYAIDQEIPIAIITGGREDSIRKRFNGLGVTDIYLNSMNKMEDFKDFLFKYGLETRDVLYMGDDIPDTEVLQEAGIATCPADATPEVKRLAAYISPYKGGEGCVRDVIEQVLKTQEKWEVKTTASYAQ